MTPDAKARLQRITATFTQFRLPLVVTSTDRTAAHNEAVGGAASSLHLVGRAADVVPVNFWNRPEYYPFVAQAARQLGASQAIVEADHVHLEFPR